MDARRFIERESARCRRCGACRDVCDIAASLGDLPLVEAVARVAGGTADMRAQWFTTRCSLCTRCKHGCADAVDLPAMVIAARSIMAAEGLLDLAKYRPMFVDCDWNAITLYRDVYELDFSCNRREQAQVAFLPGCTLLNEAPQVARRTHEWLEDALQCEVGLIDRCCGMPLQEMGLIERYEAYVDDLKGQLKQMGARKLIVACPNCLGRLAQHGPQVGITIQIVYELMAAMGLRAPILGEGRACVHDSCPARGTQVGTWVREILADWDIAETKNHGDCSQCCGSGGAVGMYDPVLSGLRAQRRREELAQAGADVCVAYCMSSVSALFDAQALPNIRHVLELAFGAHVDHEQHARRVQAMWEGEAGARCDARLARAVSVIQPSEKRAAPVGQARVAKRLAHLDEEENHDAESR